MTISGHQSSRAGSRERCPKKVILCSHRCVATHHRENDILFTVLFSEIAERFRLSLLDRKYPETGPQDGGVQPEIPAPQVPSSPQRCRTGSPAPAPPALPDAHPHPRPCSPGPSQPGTISYLLSREPPLPTGWTLVPGERAAEPDEQPKEEPEEEPESCAVTCCDFTLVGGKASGCCRAVTGCARPCPRCGAAGARHPSASEGSWGRAALSRVTGSFPTAGGEERIFEKILQTRREIHHHVSRRNSAVIVSFTASVSLAQPSHSRAVAHFQPVLICSGPE